MIARSTVTFAEVQRLLLDVGFAPTRRAKYWYFKHARSGSMLAYRAYRPRERVTLIDLEKTRFDLDWHDLVPTDAFDDRLGKTRVLGLARPAGGSA